MKEKIVTVEEILKIIKEHRESYGWTEELDPQVGPNIGVTNGCFDLYHPGHLQFLEEAKGWVSCLIVLVNDDESVRALKGEWRPIYPLEDRMMMVASHPAVDFVVPFSGESPRFIIEQIKPDILIKGTDWESKKIRSSEFAKKTVLVEKYKNYSTSTIIDVIVEDFMTRFIDKVLGRVDSEEDW